MWGNIAVQVGVNYVLWRAGGWGALRYVFLSTFFALGLHPLGGRWLQEHYDVMGIPQETYSYYGPLNWVMLNMGFHNEHHDFPMVAWCRLPQLWRLAPDFYQPLYAHQSYTRLLLHFICNKNRSAFSRWVRSDAQTLLFSIFKFFQVDMTGIVRMTSSARYFKAGVGSRRPNWRWLMCFLELPKAKTSCKAFVKRLSFSWGSSDDTKSSMTSTRHSTCTLARRLPTV